jgi:hypothetical protein
MNRRDMLKVSLGSVIAAPLLFGQEAGAASVRRDVTVDAVEGAHWTAESDVVWTTPSKDSAGSMPLGNGEVGINLWVEEGGDLRFIISRSDAFSELGRLIKVGGVRVSLTPNPFAAGAPFQQALRLRDGVCEITAGDEQGRVVLRVFVDSEQPIVHCVGEASGPVQVQAKVESWRQEAQTLITGDEKNSAWTMQGAPFPLVESADIFPPVARDAVAWYHRNETSPAFTETLRVQSLEAASGTIADPLRHRTFGGWLTGTGFAAAGADGLSTPAPVHSFALRVAAPCLQTEAASEWIMAAHQAAALSGDAGAALRRTSAWWRAYWERSWVVVGGDRGVEIPGNEKPLRIGYDSDHQNTFPGTLGRTGVYGRALSDAEIGQLAAAGYGLPAPVKTGLLSGGDGTPREIAADALDLRHGFTLEAWVKTDRTRPGRIFDRITAGERDGFLLDTEPKDALRFILGQRQLQAPAGALVSGSWQHVAAMADAETGAARLYLDGKVVAELPDTDTRSPVTRGYTLQRYVQACGGRGTYPIKFNGGIFTVEPKAEGKPMNADWRQWGDAHWYQNIRHMYHPMPAGGDAEMMDPFFGLYERVRPLAEARTRLYHGAQGSYFPETMTVWGTYANSDYGWDRKGKQPRDVDSPWWRYAWNQGPELVALFLDRWDYTQDERFLQDRVLPMAVSVLTYFDTRFAKDAQGRVRLDPAQAVETLWTGVVNDMPTTAGLNEITVRLCALPGKLTSPAQRVFFTRMKSAVPIVPIEDVEVDGTKQRTLAPAQAYDPKRSNCENPEMYAVWPFRIYGVGRPDLEAARTAYAHRVNHLDVGWGYDGNCAALLGLADEAARIMKVKCANSNPKHRWPATWGPNFDWLPDQNHGGNLLETTQLMLLQSVGQQIFLLPAWPKGWDVSFRLHAPQKTAVECVYRSGKIEHLAVTPHSRQHDIVLPNPSA